MIYLHSKFYKPCSKTSLATVNYVEMSPSSKLTVPQQQIPCILWNLKFHYHIHDSLPLVPIMGQMNPVLTLSSYLRLILILSFQLPLCLSSISSSRFSYQNSVSTSLISYVYYMSCPDVITLIIFGKIGKVVPVLN
jgi:hypothetical protein